MKSDIIIPAKIQGFKLLGVNCNSLPRPSQELYQTVNKVYLTWHFENFKELQCWIVELQC